MAEVTNKFFWVSKGRIKAARKSGKTCCDTCAPDRVPGFIYNAWQWINCPECNPTTTVEK